MTQSVNWAEVPQLLTPWVSPITPGCKDSGKVRSECLTSGAEPLGVSLSFPSSGRVSMHDPPACSLLEAMCCECVCVIHPPVPGWRPCAALDGGFCSSQ